MPRLGWKLTFDAVVLDMVAVKALCLQCLEEFVFGIVGLTADFCRSQPFRRLLRFQGILGIFGILGLSPLVFAYDRYQLLVIRHRGCPLRATKVTWKKSAVEKRIEQCMMKSVLRIQSR